METMTPFEKKVKDAAEERAKNVVSPGICLGCPTLVWKLHAKIDFKAGADFATSQLGPVREALEKIADANTFAVTTNGPELCRFSKADMIAIAKSALNLLREIGAG